MDLLYLVIILVNLLIDRIDTVIMKRVDTKMLINSKRIIFTSHEESVLQCAQRCKLKSRDAMIKYEGSRCTCIKNGNDDKKPEKNQGTISGLFMNHKMAQTHVQEINGMWGKWTNSTICTKTCGNGTLEQIRLCDSPKPKYGGADCEGVKNRTVSCNTQECPVANVALNKMAAQSSTYDNDNGYSASNAVDGNNSTSACTNYKYHSWLEVDMEEARVIKDIKLNAFVSSGINDGILVETREAKDESWILCKDLGDIKERITKFTCIEQLTKAQYLRIRSTKRCIVQIYEIEVYGH